MNVLVSGAGGMIGAACVESLRTAGHEAQALSRTGVNGLPWNVETGKVNLMGFEPEGVVHLAGEPIAQKWTEASKRRIWASRVEATQRLCEFLAGCPTPPKVFLAGSAIGIYGPGGDQWIDESGSPASDFLGELCSAWEDATKPLAAVGCRVVQLRTGIVLSAKGGALAQMLPFFRFGFGGPIGNGRHWMSWISLEDHVRAMAFLLEKSEARGAFNLVAPNPARNGEFAHALGQALRRPAFLPAPAALLRMVYGDLVGGALLSSQRVKPQALMDLGFQWNHPELAEALWAML